MKEIKVTLTVHVMVDDDENLDDANVMKLLEGMELGSCSVEKVEEV